MSTMQNNHQHTQLVKQVETAQHLYDQWVKMDFEKLQLLSSCHRHTIRNQMAIIKLCVDLFAMSSKHISAQRQQNLLVKLREASDSLEHLFNKAVQDDA